jgi:hypothetical protein
MAVFPPATRLDLCPVAPAAAGVLGLEVKDLDVAMQLGSSNEEIWEMEITGDVIGYVCIYIVIYRYIYIIYIYKIYWQILAT